MWDWKVSKGPDHTGLKSQVPSHLRSIRAISAVERIIIGTYLLPNGVSSSKYDMDVYMTTLFGGEIWDVC